VLVLFGERSLTVSDLENLCAAFLKLPGMRERSTRDLYIDQFNGQFANTLSVSRYPDPQHDVWSLLRACQNASPADVDCSQPDYQRRR